ncbi:hypothetical protein B5P44_00140 [Mycobacterium sp. CBMA 213]|uniref:Non-heme chloroperoxidase n=1 Tax=Mycolicibacterium sp. CBMA 213 TaxID=1968788 RepID=A0A343VR05_9MYCO|nr:MULTISPECIES: alpha/beta hydrolase [unclassified Mycolicibacterium]AVN58329.1 Non-heme chloroperoxidase [Mycolicibacterium sp. CBMA 213]MUL60994.1 alpha/beta hydrolase [Mycolicibacterium sp. CBMA 335]MUM03231.1 hypothetical protein [Mycolicibacterium sp. CBMA 213]
MTAALEDVAPQCDIDCGNRQRTPQHKLVRVSDGTTLAVEDWCPPTKPEHNVVFLHGFCLSHQEWLNQIGYVTEEFGREVRTIALDYRGHGRSSAADMRTYTISQCANDLAEVLDVLKVEGPVTFVGHSMGGMIVLEYQSLPKAKRPVDPANVILVATAAGHLVQSGIGRLLGTSATAALFDVVHHTPEAAWRLASGAIGAILGRWNSHCPSHQIVAAAIATALATTSVCTAVGFLPSLKGFDQYNTLRAITANTIVVSGGCDVLTPAILSRDLAAAIPACKHLHLPMAGHMIPQEAPAVINRAIAEAIRSTRKPETIGKSRATTQSTRRTRVIAAARATNTFISLAGLVPAADLTEGQHDGVLEA